MARPGFFGSEPGGHRQWAELDRSSAERRSGRRLMQWIWWRSSRTRRIGSLFFSANEPPVEVQQFLAGDGLLLGCQRGVKVPCSQAQKHRCGYDLLDQRALSISANRI